METLLSLICAHSISTGPQLYGLGLVPDQNNSEILCLTMLRRH